MRSLTLTLLSIFHEEDTKHYPINGLTSNFQESRYTSDCFFSKYSLHFSSVTLSSSRWWAVVDCLHHLVFIFYIIRKFSAKNKKYLSYSFSYSFFVCLFFSILISVYVSPGYGVEHAQCVPPSEYSEPGFITESYQTLHPISSEELLTLKYESEYPAVILRDTALNSMPGDYFSVKQEMVSPDNMSVGRLSRGEGAHEPHD